MMIDDGIHEFSRINPTKFILPPFDGLRETLYKTPLPRTKLKQGTTTTNTKDILAQIDSGHYKPSTVQYFETYYLRNGIRFELIPVNVGKGV